MTTKRKRGELTVGGRADTRRRWAEIMSGDLPRYGMPPYQKDDSDDQIARQLIVRQRHAAFFLKEKAKP